MAGVTHQLSETAYLVAESRARAVAISRDVYAARWIPDHLREPVRRLWDEFAAEVYPHDDVVLGVRNRFFLERLSVFAAAQPTIFVNIAAGFTSYPFLLEHAVRSIEIDLPAVVDAKSARLQELQQAAVLPIRPVRLICADLNEASDRERIGSLLAALDGARSFVLLEGISYYLAPRVLDALLASLALVQPAGSVVALDYWPLALEQHEVFTKLRRFFARRFGFDTAAYNLLDLDRLAGLDGYRLIESTHVSQQERAFAASRTLQDTSRILWEHYAVLERV